MASVTARMMRTERSCRRGASRLPATMPGIDAVTVSTPDHHHFHASMLAMRKGEHVYCQKPISHSIWEARRLAETAAQMKVQTQMGNQAHAGEPIRRAVELVAGRVPLEASGGVRLDSIRAIAETGVDFISVGRITQSAPAVDIGMDYSLAR